MPVTIALVRARYDAQGGAERFTQLTIDALSEEGARVTLLTRSWQGTGQDRTPLFEQIRCDPFYLGSTWRDWSFVRAVRQALAQRTFDLVQSHERLPGAQIYRAGDGVHAAWLARRTKGLGWLARIGIALNPHHAYLCRIERQMFEHPALRAVICNSHLVRAEIAERFQIIPERLHVIYNGVDLQRFMPAVSAAERAFLRAAHQIDPSVALLVLVGSGFARKGLSTLLDALSVCPDIHLVVVGRDKHAARYVRQAARLGLQSRCTFLGAVEDAAPCYRMADAFVLPTLYDPFPNAALEALASGLPIIVSNGCGAMELVQQGENGFVAEAGDRNALAVQLRAWHAQWRDAAQREAMARAAQRTAQGFDVVHMGQQLLALYRHLLGHAQEGAMLKSSASAYDQAPSRANP